MKVRATTHAGKPAVGTDIGHEVATFQERHDEDSDGKHLAYRPSAAFPTATRNFLNGLLELGGQPHDRLGLHRKQPKSEMMSSFISTGMDFFATGRVKTVAVPRRDWPNRYGIQIESIKLIDPPISLGAIRRHIPDLTWAIYPRSITTPSPEIAERVWALVVKRRRARIPEDVDSAALEQANTEELRKVALMRAKPNVSSRRRIVIERAASAAIRVYVLRRAAGYCEGCAAVAPFRCIDGSAYLEAHQTARLADGGPDHPAKVIALCSNCHRRVHYSADGKRFNIWLMKKLRRLEGDSKR